ncbi:MAG: response regulator, partial [Bacteroidales bacterium]|nr:response regulator [Bacteroidales bacterium]
MRTILAIDDQQDNITTIKAVIKSHIPNCRVLIAQSGKEGIELAQQKQPDTILLDIIMPQMDGYETCKRLKENELTKHIPVVMITAIKTDSESRAKGLNMGADAFLSKPIDPVEISAQVNVMLRIKKAEDKLRVEKNSLKETVSEKIDELKESEDKFRMMVLNSSDLTLIQNSDGELTYISPQAYEVIGHKGDKFLKKKLPEFIHPDDKKKVIGVMQEALKGKDIQDFEYRFIGEKRQIIWLSHTARAIKNNGKIAAIQSTIRNITKQKLAEGALKISEERLKIIFESAPDAIYLNDLKGNFLD